MNDINSSLLEGLMNSNAAIIYCDRTFNFIWVNNRFCKLFGFELQSIIGQNAKKVLLPMLFAQNRNLFLNQLKLRSEGLQDGVFELKWNTVNGPLQTIIRSTALKDANGEFAGSVVIFTDITEHKQLQEELTQSESLLREAQDAAQMGHWEFDIATNEIYISESMSKVLEYPPGERWTLSKMLQLIHPDDLQKVTEGLKKLSEGKTRETVVRFYTRLGSVKHLYFKSFPLFKNGLPVKKRGIVINVTELREKDQMNQELIRQLKNKVNDLEQISYITSHNLRGSVKNVLSLTAMIDQQMIDSATAEVIAYINKAVKKLDDSLTDLNELLKMKTGVIAFEDVLHLRDCIQLVCDSLNFEREEAAAVIEIHVSPALSIVSNAVLMKSVIYNLVSNSIKYRSPERPCLITIKHEVVNDKHVLTFTDNGLGIDLQGNKENLFGLYKRFHDHVPGTGLGLYMVKTQVELMGGSIDVKSTVNYGTSFIITLNR